MSKKNEKEDPKRNGKEGKPNEKLKLISIPEAEKRKVKVQYRNSPTLKAVYRDGSQLIQHSVGGVTIIEAKEEYKLGAKNTYCK